MIAPGEEKCYPGRNSHPRARLFPYHLKAKSRPGIEKGWVQWSSFWSEQYHARSNGNIFSASKFSTSSPRMPTYFSLLNFLVLRPFQFHMQGEANSGHNEMSSFFQTIRCLFVMFVTAVCFLYLLIIQPPGVGGPIERRSEIAKTVTYPSQGGYRRIFEKGVRDAEHRRRPPMGAGGNLPRKTFKIEVLRMELTTYGAVTLPREQPRKSQRTPGGPKDR